MAITDRFNVRDYQGNPENVICEQRRIPTGNLDRSGTYELGTPHFQLSDGTGLKPIEGDGKQPGDVFEDSRGRRWTRN